MSEHVQGFNSMDEMLSAMAAQEDIANSNLLPGQVRLRDEMDRTTYWVQAIPEHDLVIYGEAHATGRVQADAGFDATENRERGYLTGKAYSVAAESGEYGDTHVSQVIPISVTTFNLARVLGWPTYSQLREPENRTLAAILGAAERVAMGREV